MGDEELPFQTNSAELQIIPRWTTVENKPQCSLHTDNPYTHYVVCRQTFDVMTSRLKKMEGAESGSTVIIIVVAVVVVAIIVSLAFYIHRLKSKLNGLHQKHGSGPNEQLLSSQKRTTVVATASTDAPQDEEALNPDQASS